MLLCVPSKCCIPHLLDIGCYSHTIDQREVCKSYLPIRGRQFIGFFEVLSTVNASIQNAYMPNTLAVIGKVTGMPASSQKGQQWLLYARSCVQPGLDYFQTKFSSASLVAFQVARMFLPYKPSAVDEIQAFTFSNVTILNGLKQELPSYTADVSPSIEKLTW